MKRIVWILSLALVWAVTGNAQHTAKPAPVFVIHGPTIVAFFPAVTEKDLESDPDTNEALSDFQFYYGAVKGRLHDAGIVLCDADASSFRIRIGRTIRRFQTGKIGIGYYFIVPGKEPHVEYGVMTDADLLDVARKYFGIRIP